MSRGPGARPTRWPPPCSTGSEVRSSSTSSPWGSPCWRSGACTGCCERRRRPLARPRHARCSPQPLVLGGQHLARDFTWALALGLAGAVAAKADRRVLAGALFGLGIGCRASTVLLGLAWLVAERTGDDDEDRPSWSDTARTAGTLVVVGGLCFVPPWLSVDRSLDFLQNELEFAGWRVHAGRFVVKNLATATLAGRRSWGWAAGGSSPASGGGGRPGRAVRRADDRPVRARLPPPALQAGPPAPGGRRHRAAGRRRPARAADLADRARRRPGGGRLRRIDDGRDRPARRRRRRPAAVRIADGVVVNDMRCRLADLDRGRWPDGDSAAEHAEATARAEANFVCQRDAWRDS